VADTSLGTAVLRTKLDASGLKTGLSQAQGETEKTFKGIGDKARDAQGRFTKLGQEGATAGKKIGDSFREQALPATERTTASVKGLSAAIGAIAASQGLRAYVGFMRDSATLAHQATASAALFQKALERNNQSAAEGAAVVQRLADKFGVVNSVVEESATFMLRQGASLDDVERALTAAGASAAAAGVDISMAFNNVGVAVATGRSQLLETSGIVANLGPVAQAYAKSVGKTVEQLTQQELIQARVNAIYDETKSEIEDVDILLRGLPRSQAEVTRQWRSFRETAGDLALKVIVPLTEGLGTMLRLANSLPTPVKNAGIAMVGAAVGATALATGFVAIKTALTGLSGLGLLSFGPAGWIVLGVTAVAGLAAVLATGGSSLTAALDSTRKAVASGNKDSMTGALDELVKQVDGPLKASLQGLRDELVATGDVGVEQAKRILTDVAIAVLDTKRQVLGASLFGPTPLGGALAQAGGLMGNVNLASDIRTALDNNELLTAIDLLQDAIVAMTEAGLRPAYSQPIVDFLAQVGAIPNFKFTPTPTPTTVPPPGGGSGAGVGTGGAARVWSDVLAELDKAGTEAMRRAAFEGTPAAYREAAQKRVGLIDNAITEALTEFHGQVSASDLAALRARRDTAALQAREPVPAAAPPDPAARAALRALAAAIMADTMQAMSDAAEVDRQARVAGHREALTINADLRRQAAAIRADTAQAQADARAAEEAQRAYIDSLADSGDELGRWLTTASSLTATIKAANDETARMSVFAGAVAKYGAGRVGLAGTSAADRGGLQVLTGRDAAAAVARDTVQAFHDGRVGVDEVRAAVDALTTLTPLSVAAINELTDGILKLDRAAQDAARAAEQNERAPMWSPVGGLPSVPGVALPSSGYQGFRPRQDNQSDLANAARINREREQAADQFANTVVSAGFAFGDAAIKAFQDGDVVGIIRSGLSGAGSIVGSIGMEPISLFGGMINPATLIAGGIGLLGTLIGALAGGGSRDAEERRRREQQQARSVPAININFTVNQSNTYNGAPRDPANEQAFARQADSLFESIYRRHLGPRLDRIEQRLGIAGA